MDWGNTTWYLLSEHPEVERRLHAELREILGERLPTVDDLPRLTYTRMVLSEFLRLYPPAWVLGRRSLVDYEVGGYNFPAGSVVLVSQYLMHHDPRFFPDPWRFDPDRWGRHAEPARPRFAYFPFGGGPRQCIGEAFAWMEEILVLATLAQSWRLRLVPDQPVVLNPLITLRPKHAMPMTLHRR